MFNVDNGPNEESGFHGHAIPTHTTPEEERNTVAAWEEDQSPSSLRPLDVTMFLDIIFAYTQQMQDISMRPIDLTPYTAWNGLFSLIETAKDMYYGIQHLPDLICLCLETMAIIHDFPPILPTTRQMSILFLKIEDLIELIDEIEHKASWERGHNFYTLYDDLYSKLDKVGFELLVVADQLQM